MDKLHFFLLCIIAILSFQLIYTHYFLESSAHIHPINPFPIGRRVVTGFDENGKSTILTHRFAPPKAYWYIPNYGKGYQAWVLNQVPTNLADLSETMTNGYNETSPPD